jgi:hypothetical protein
MASWRSRDDESRPNAIVGAARRVHVDNRNEIERIQQRGIAVEQELAWRYYDKISEIKTAYNYFASVASRVRLYAGYQSDISNAPAPIGDVGHLSRSLVVAARQELDKLNRGRGGQPNLIRQFVLNLLVPGECYLVGVGNTWTIRSTSELQFENSEDAGRRIKVITSRNRRGADYKYLPPDAFVARIWRTHPQFSDEADSALLGLLDDCGELLLLSRLIRASDKSRLNAGLLYVADELRFQRSTDPGGPDAPQPDIDPFEEELTLALTEPIGETDSPSEVLPLIVRGPQEFSKDGIQRYDLSRNIQETDIKRFDQVLTRIMRGLDLPTELITGLANVRYSNARTISEDFLKAYIEPMILIICEGLTTVFLRPQLLARGFDPDFVKNVHVWYDPSEVVTRPDRSDDADKGYDKMLVAGRTWRRAHGFSEDDAPQHDELAKRIAFAGSLIPQSTTLDFLRAVDPKLMETVERLAQESMNNPALNTPQSNFNPTAGQPTDPAAMDGPQAPGPDAAPAEAPPTADNPPPVEPPEGGLEGGVNGRPTMSVESERVDRLVDLIRSMTAAAALESTPSVEARDKTRRLERALEVERRLRDSMLVHLNDVVQRALERAGARTVSKVRGDQDLRQSTLQVPIEEAFSVIPADRRAAFALNEDNLLRDSIEKAKDGYFTLVKKAQEQGWRALSGEVYDALADKQDDWIEKSWKWLVNKLVSLASGWLRNPKRNGSYVSMDVVRDAATLAGGGTHDTEVPDPSLPRSKPQESGRAVLSLEAIGATGWEFSERYRWVYGISDNHFEPHLQLDGTIFDSWGGRELAASSADEWPYTSHYFPGDHNGCRCDWLPEVMDARQVNAPERGVTWEPIAASGELVDTNRPDVVR